MRQYPAANQNRPINKDSKSSNPRSLKQHTPAEPISPCCCCSCPAREIGRFTILICRCLLHPIEIKVLNKVLILVAFAYIYLRPPPSSPAFAFTSPRLPHLLWNFQLQQQRVTIPERCQWILFQCRPIRRSGIVASRRSLKERRG